MSVAPSITSAEQLFAAGDIGRCELVAGELTMMSPASPNHGHVANEIAYLITRHVKDHGLGAVFAAETGFIIQHNPDTVRAPDVAFVGIEKASQIPERGFFPGAPDLAVEVLSPDDSASDVLAKVEQWLAAGTGEVWVADPIRKTIAIHSAADPARMFGIEESLIGSGVLPGFSIRLADVYR